jgi:hypothetical protein
MARQISIENLERLALLASRVSLVTPIHPKPHQYQVYVPVRIVRQIREPLSTAGIEAIEYDWTDTQVEIPPALVLFVLCQHGVLSC